MPVGSTVTGTVAQHSRFGYFVDLATGHGTSAFCNVAADKKDTIKVGSPLDVVIETVDGEKRRISLSCGTIEVKQQASEVQEYLNSQASQAKPMEKTVPQSEFAEALKTALRKKTINKGAGTEEFSEKNFNCGRAGYIGSHVARAF